MPSRHRCFLITPTENIVVTLRRYAYKDSKTPDVPICGRQEPRYPGADLVTHDTHNAEVEIAREVGTVEGSLDGNHTLGSIPREDPRWPTRCVCGYEFQDTDHWQESRTRLYKRSDNGELVTTHDAPVGALYNARWLDYDAYQRNEPHVALMCKTPAGEWMIDGPATNGPGWTRTGTPPDIDVTPSIGIGNPQRMHGWLRHGWLEIDNP